VSLAKMQIWTGFPTAPDLFSQAPASHNSTAIASPRAGSARGVVRRKPRGRHVEGFGPGSVPGTGLLRAVVSSLTRDSLAAPIQALLHTCLALLLNRG
jgi:hypothetical protein